MGFNGIILVAYVVAILTNEIVILTILMLTLTLGSNVVDAHTGVMLELEDAQIFPVLTEGGWTLLTAVNWMLYRLLHNPCSTTILTIWNETKGLRWPLVTALLPLALGVLATFSITTIARFIGMA